MKIQSLHSQAARVFLSTPVFTAERTNSQWTATQSEILNISSMWFSLVFFIASFALTCGWKWIAIWSFFFRSLIWSMYDRVLCLRFGSSVRRTEMNLRWASFTFKSSSSPNIVIYSTLTYSTFRNTSRKAWRRSDTMTIIQQRKQCQIRTKWFFILKKQRDDDKWKTTTEQRLSYICFSIATEPSD